jgi:hypothetical protein
LRHSYGAQSAKLQMLAVHEARRRSAGYLYEETL